MRHIPLSEDIKDNLEVDQNYMLNDGTEVRITAIDEFSVSYMVVATGEEDSADINDFADWEPELIEPKTPVSSITGKEITIENLIILELKIFKAFNSSKSPTAAFMESKKCTAFKEQWVEMMNVLRGWADHKGDSVTTELWKHYCKDEDVDENYNFGNILEDEDTEYVD